MLYHQPCLTFNLAFLIFISSVLVMKSMRSPIKSHYKLPIARKELEAQLILKLGHASTYSSTYIHPVEMYQKTAQALGGRRSHSERRETMRGACCETRAVCTTAGAGSMTPLPCPALPRYLLCAVISFTWSMVYYISLFTCSNVITAKCTLVLCK